MGCNCAQIDAGGEVVITQLFYDVDRFFKFVKDCRSIGITAPIIPGVLPTAQQPALHNLKDTAGSIRSQPLVLLLDVLL